MAIIDQLSVSLVARTTQWSKGLSRAQKDLSRFARHVTATATGVSGMATALLGVGTIGGLGALVKQQADLIETSGAFAGRLRTSTEELVAFRYAAVQSEVDAGAFDMALTQLVKRTEEAARGTGTAGDALRDLGIDAQAFSQMPLADQLLLLAQRFSQMADAGRATKDVMDLMGRGGAPMLQFFSQGPDAIKAMTDRARQLGLLFSNIDAAKVDEANDALADLGFLAQGAARSVAIALAPTIEGLANHLIDASGGGKTLGDAIVDAMTRAAISLTKVADLVSLLKGEWYGFQGIVLMVADLVVQAFQKMGAGIDWLLKKIPGSSFFLTPDNQRQFNQEQDFLKDLSGRLSDAAMAAFEKSGKSLTDFAGGVQSKALQDFFAAVTAAGEATIGARKRNDGGLPERTLGKLKFDPFAARAVSLRDTFVGALGGQGAKRQTVHDPQLMQTNELLRAIKREMKGPVAL